MRDLVPSGTFAQLARLSRKALRLYAEQGLLRPAHVNPETGYRYYSLGQLEDAARIAHLRELGMPLDAVHEALRAWNSPDLKEHLERHRQRLQAQAVQLQAALQTLDELLQAPMQEYRVGTKQLEPQPYLGIRAWCAPEEACERIGSAQQQLDGILRDLIVPRAGSTLVWYHDEEDEAWDIEVCVPVTQRVEAPPGTIGGALPGGSAVFTIHAGDCGGIHGLQRAYAALWQRIQIDRCETLGGPYEVYLFDQTNTERSEDFRTEVGWMVRTS